MTASPASHSFDAVGTPRTPDGQVDLGPRICVECGVEFLPPQKGPGQHKRFHDRACQLKFANREKARGAVLVTIAEVYALTRHGHSEDDKRLRASMRTEMTRILTAFIAEDRRAGRLGRLRSYARQRVNIDACYNERSRRAA